MPVPCSRLLPWACLLMGLAPGALPAADDAPAPAADRFREPVARLGDPDYEVREQAVASLLQAGADAIDPLVMAAQSQSIEVAARAVSVLERLFLSEDAEVADRADDALETLARSENSRTALRADTVLSRHYELRERRAVRAIRGLGGIVQFVEDERDLMMGPQFGWQGGPTWGPEDFPTLPLKLDKIVLGTDWKGGVEGLKHLRRLRHRAGFQLYVIRGSEVPFEKAEGLSRVVRNLTVFDRGPFLGVSGGHDSTGCIVRGVTPDASAHRADIREHDEIIALDGKTISRFQDLVEALTAYRPGDTVSIRVKRIVALGPVELDLSVTLDRWEPYFADSADLAPPEPSLPIPEPQLR